MNYKSLSLDSALSRMCSKMGGDTYEAGTDAMQYDSPLLYDAVRSDFDSIQFNTMRFDAIRCNAEI